MIFRRVLLALMAAATLSAAAAVIVVAMAFALYALVEPRLGRAGAAATVAGATAGFVGLMGLALALAGSRRRSRKASTLTGSFVERAMQFIREKPIVAASAAVGAGLMAARNPKYLGETLRAFFEGAPSSK